MKDVYFNPNYSQVYKDIDGESKTFTFECPFGKVTNTFIMRKIPWTLDGNVYYDIVTPYGYGGPYAENVMICITDDCTRRHLLNFVKQTILYANSYVSIFCNVDVREIIWKYITFWITL